MKRVALVLSLLSALPAIASAQVGFGVAAGAAFPMGDYGKGLSSGYHAQASLDLSIPLAPIGFRFDGSLDHFDYSNSGTTSSSSRIIGGEANVLMGFGAVPLLGPYVIAGVGAYNVNNSALSSSATKLGGSVGAGIRFGLAGFGVFAETGYHYIQSPGTGATGNIAPSYVPVMFGISF